MVVCDPLRNQLVYMDIACQGIKKAVSGAYQVLTTRLVDRHRVAMERIPVTRFSFRRKGSHRAKDKGDKDDGGYDYDKMTYLR